MAICGLTMSFWVCVADAGVELVLLANRKDKVDLDQLIEPYCFIKKDDLFS